MVRNVRQRTREPEILDLAGIAEHLAGTGMEAFLAQGSSRLPCSECGAQVPAGDLAYKKTRLPGSRWHTSHLLLPTGTEQPGNGKRCAPCMARMLGAPGVYKYGRSAKDSHVLHAFGANVRREPIPGVWPRQCPRCKEMKEDLLSPPAVCCICKENFGCDECWPDQIMLSECGQIFTCWECVADADEPVASVSYEDYEDEDYDSTSCKYCDLPYYELVELDGCNPYCGECKSVGNPVGASLVCSDCCAHCVEAGHRCTASHLPGEFPREA